jgi:hypothetical protein
MTTIITMRSPGLFAIAMTLLVMGIKRPESDALTSSASLWRFLTHEWESVFAFLPGLRPAVGRVAQAAPAHGPGRSAGPDVHGVAYALAALRGPPSVPTALLGHAIDNPLALCIFAASEAALLFSEAALKEVAHRSRSVLSPDACVAEVRRGASSSWAVAGFFAVTTALPWAVPAIPFAWLLAPATCGGRLIDRFRRGAGPVAA